MFPLNLPNALTLLRILAVPVVVVALLVETPNGDALAAAIFALAAATDGLDGYFARSRGSITTFGKLMDPLADKLLIIGALVSLVSLDRLEAWVAMVIIAREVAVTILRTIAAERGIVIAASWLGKLKTVLQIAAVIALIIANPAPLGVDLLVYAAVFVTVISGADYFFGLRKRIEEERKERSATKAGGRLTLRTELRGPSDGAPSGRPSPAASKLPAERRSFEPLAHRLVPGAVLAGGELGSQLAERAVALGDDVVAVDRLQVLLAGHDVGVVGQVGVALDHLAHHLAHAVLDEARLFVGLDDDRHLVGALHQLVDLRAHRALDDPQQLRRIDPGRAALGAADVQGADPALVVGRDRHRLDHPLDLAGLEALGGEPFAGEAGDHLLRAGAGGHALGLDAGQRPGACLGVDRGAEEDVDLLRAAARSSACGPSPGSAP